MIRKTWILALGLVVGLGALSLAESETKGAAEGSGKAINWWIFGRSIRGKVDVNGNKVSFRWSYSARSHRRLGEITYQGTLEGNTVTFSGTTTGIVGALAEEENNRSEVLFKGPLTIKDGKLTLDVDAQKTVKVHGYRVRGLKFEGSWEGESNDENEPEEDEGSEDVTTLRVPIGRDGIEIKPETRYEVIVPLAGTLTLEASAGKLSVKRPDGSAVEELGDSNKAEIKVDDKQLGKYTVEIAEGSGPLPASFVQDGRIDARIRPWSSHTWYPINHYSSGTSENDATMFHSGGPLEKYDEALELEGNASAHNWEINGYGNRTGLAFENGHYSRISSPKEKNWIVDCNLNGVRNYKDDDDFMKIVDGDEDGTITREELTAHARDNAVLKFWKTYDENGDGFVTDSEISAGFISKYDSDDDKKLSEKEWGDALKKDYSDLLDRNAKSEVDRTLEERDGDGDGKLSKKEASPANGMDVIDKGDQDEDGRDFYDVNNIVVIMKDGTKHVGNKFEEADGVVTLFKGYKQDVKVGEYARSKIQRIRENAADGEFTGSYSVGWWGHCNAWAMAAILFQVPKEEVEHNGVKFSVRDQKGLLVELAMRDTNDSSFWWRQWNNTEDMPDKKYAAGFHNQLKKWLRDEQQGMMADMDLKPARQTTGFQVWNYPLLGYVATVREADGDDPYVLELTVDIQKGSYSDEDSESSQTVTYTLHFDESGSIRSDDDSKTDWTTKKGWGDDAPKGYVRYLIHPFGFTSNLSSANPKVTQENLEKIFGGPLKRNSLEALAEAEAAAGDGSSN